MSASATAYRINPDRALREELHSIARGQIDGALKALAKADAAPEEAVHDLRKRMKKLRALLRLVRPGLGAHYAAENRAFRDIARLFADMRDAQVLSATLERLAEADGGDILPPLVGWAARRRESVLADSELPDRIAEATARLEAVRARVVQWPVEGGDRAVICDGLKAVYGRARKAWRKAEKRPDDPARLHEWRKQVKYHRHHCRLLAGARPATMQARLESLQELADALGDDHDLVMLRDRLKAEAPHDLPAAALRRAEVLAAEKSAALRGRAFALAPRVLHEKKGALADRIAGTWPGAAVGV